MITLGGVVALAAGAIVRHPNLPLNFFVLSWVALGTGVACLLVRWGTLPARYLHAVPVLATVEVALGVRFAGSYGDIAANYYIFIVLFAAYAFSSRRATAAYVALACVASSLPLLYFDPDPSATITRTVVRMTVLIAVAVVVTVLREELEEHQRGLEVLATHDPLTGVGNYRLLTDRLEYEIVRHRRSGGCLTVMLLDLDGFKGVNDTLGHLAGDRTLRQVAAALSGTVRAQDTLARQGGDEFSILAPDTTTEQAERLAARARRAVHAATGGSLSTSIGWVSSSADTHDAETLLALADANLRAAKRELGTERSGRRAV